MGGGKKVPAAVDVYIAALPAELPPPRLETIAERMCLQTAQRGGAER